MESDFSKKIKTLRLERGMTLEQVATIVGVGKSTVRKWETGAISNMGRDKIDSLAKALGVTPAYLMGWDETTNHPKNPLRELPSRQQAFLDAFEKIPEQKRDMVLTMIEALLNSL